MTTPTEVNIGTLIERKPGVDGGRAILKGTRTPVSLIAEVFEREHSAEAVLNELPHIDPSLIMAGIAYYIANKQLVENETAEDRRAFDVEAARHTATNITKPTA